MTIISVTQMKTGEWCEEPNNAGQLTPLQELEPTASGKVLAASGKIFFATALGPTAFTPQP